MKNLFYVFGLFILFLSGCTNNFEDDIVPINDNRNDKVYFLSRNIYLNSYSTRASNDILNIEKINYEWENPIDIFERFPESKKPEGTYGDYVFESNGQPFNVIMLYSNGAYSHELGLYYYDENGDTTNVKLWVETEESSSDWRNEGGSKTPSGISRLTDNAGAYIITIPEGTRFGFYQISYQGGKIKDDGHGNNYIFFTEQELNYNNDIQSMSYQTIVNNQSWTIIGMEDIGLPGGDKDYNDVVFALNPSPKMIAKDDETGEEIEVIPECSYTGEVEFDIYYQEHKDWNEIKTSIHLRDTVDAKVFIPIPKEYQCDVDDFAIRVSQPDNIYYKTDKVKVGADWYDVTYYVSHKSDGIEIFLKGSKLAEVLKKSREIYDDGITLEVHSYIAYERLINGIVKTKEEDIWEWIRNSIHSTVGKTEHKGQISSAYRDEEIKIKDFGDNH